MNSGMIGKIDKANRYAHEPERMRINQFSASFHGSHDDYEVTLTGDEWHCTCHTFESHVLDTCPHVMAAQHLLRPMLSERARFAAHEDVAIAV